MAASRRGDWLFVRLSAGELAGWGEASQSRADGTVAHLLGGWKQLLLGQAVGAAFEALNSRYREDVWRGGAGLAGVTAASALEQALWDLRAQALGVPLSELLGGARRGRVSLYANLNRGTRDRTPAGFAAAALAAVEAEFDAVKVTPFDEVSLADRDPRRRALAVTAGLDRVRAVQQAVAGRARFFVDCHGRFDRALAVEVGRELERLGAGWYEDPIWAEEDPEGLSLVAKALDIPVVAGEQVSGLGRHADLVRRQAVDILSPDVKHCGGIWEMVRIATVAEAAGLGVAPHNPSGPVSTLATVHVASAMPNLVAVEFPFGEVEWRDDFGEGCEQIEAGSIAVPDGPGIGVRLDASRLEEVTI